MGGGDLLNLLIEKDVFEENFARFYVAEVNRNRPNASETRLSTHLPVLCTNR